MSNVFCLASNDADFAVLAECTRRAGHENHHCDGRKRLAWHEFYGPIDECPWDYHHGQPLSRAQRRGNVIHPDRAKRRIRRGGRNGR